MDVGVFVRGFVDFSKHFFPFRIVCGAATSQDELAGTPTFNQTIRLNNAHWIFESAEARDLRNDRSFGVVLFARYSSMTATNADRSSRMVVKASRPIAASFSASASSRSTRETHSAKSL